MIVPKIYNYNGEVAKEVVQLPTIEFTRPKYIFLNDKDKDKFIKMVEKIVRSSFEYKEYIDYLKNVVGMKVCSFYSNLDKDDKSFAAISIEIHHEPLTLYYIVSIIVEKFLEEDMEMNPFLVADECLKIHFMGKVGLIPLSVTVHELVHKGKVFIPLQYLDNGFMNFYEDYKPYINDKIKEVLKEKIIMSKKFNLKENEILNKKFIYLENEGYDNIPNYIEETDK